MRKEEIIKLYIADLNNLVADSDAKRSRIIDLEDELEALKQGQTLPIDSVTPRFSASLVYESHEAQVLKVLILNASCKHSALGEAMEYFENETKGFALILKIVIELNEV